MIDRIDDLRESYRGKHSDRQLAKVRTCSNKSGDFPVDRRDQSVVEARPRSCAKLQFPGGFLVVFVSEGNPSQHDCFSRYELIGRRSGFRSLLTPPRRPSTQVSVDLRMQRENFNCLIMTWIFYVRSPV